jgi:hypothetical protein
VKVSALAVSPTTNEEFIREVDDELRREQALGIWKRYGRWIIVAVFGGLALFAAYLWWQNDHETKLGVEGEKLSTVLDDLSAGKADAIGSQLAPLATADAKGVSVAARLTQADVALGKGDTKGAAALFAAVAADTKLDQPYRDLALVRQTAAEFDGMKPEDVIGRLKPLAAPGNAWFGSAGEMVGISYMRLGKNDLAGAMFAAVAKDNNVPETIRSRVVQLAGIMGVDAAPAEGVTR